MKLPQVKLSTLARDISAVSAAIVTLVSAGLLSGTAERWTTGVCAAVIAGIAILTKPSP